MATDSVGLGTFIPNAAGLPKTLAMSPAERALSNEQESAVQQVVAQVSSQQAENQEQPTQAQVSAAPTQPQDQSGGDGGNPEASDGGRGAGVDIEV